MKQLHLLAPAAFRRPAPTVMYRGRQGRRLHRTHPAPRVPPPHQQTEVLWVESERSPEDAWYATEDLWLRLAQQLPMNAQRDGTRWQIVIAGARACCDGKAQVLLNAALDPATYGWRVEGQHGSFALWIAYEGEDLVVAMPSLSSIARWPGGEDLGWQLASLLARLCSRAIEGAQGRAPAPDHAPEVRRRLASCASTSETSSPPAIPSAPAIRSSNANEG